MLTNALILISMSSIYKCPHNPGFDSQHDAFKFKLVAVKVHGRVVIIFMVPFYIPDDSNLNATLLLMALKIVGELSAPPASVVRGDEEGAAAGAEGGVEGGARIVEEGAPADSSSSRAPYSMPRRAHIKVDGVSSNWGKTMFAFFEYMVKTAIFQEILLTRGTVGKNQFIYYFIFQS